MSKKIIFYWDQTDIPDTVLINIQNFQKKYTHFEVLLLDNSIIHEFEQEFPEISFLFKKATIASYKSDIIRFLYLYRYGGIWVDCGISAGNKNIEYIYNQIIESQFEVGLSIIPERYKTDNIISPGFMIAKRKNLLFKETIETITRLSMKHYDIEKNNKTYTPYNYYTFIAPFIWENLFDINNTKLQHHIDDRKGIIEVNTKKFLHYKTCLLKLHNDYIIPYGCDTKNKGSNFDNHWSQIQKHQKLFTN